MRKRCGGQNLSIGPPSQSTGSFSPTARCAGFAFFSRSLLRAGALLEAATKTLPATSAACGSTLFAVHAQCECVWPSVHVCPVDPFGDCATALEIEQGGLCYVVLRNLHSTSIW